MSRLAYLKEEENTLRSFLSKIQAQLDALAVSTITFKHYCLHETTEPSTIATSGNAIGPERHVIAEGYRLVM